ncbi:MAG: isoprenylcysteine carboxylmethyltransferase family protein [Clostridia bacterium]|nr:isoprenylcysteine carboxylmethyltransferase family protein [Clostridia bacterium]
MKKNLLFNAIAKFAAGFFLISALLFIPAGTLSYQNAWLLMGLLFIPMLAVGAILYVKAPGLLEKRLNNAENEKEQRAVIALSALMFVIGFIIAGLDFRFSLSRVPDWLVFAASLALLAGYGLFCQVMRQNAFLSRTVEIQENQTVVDTGLYAVVRHPMYMATIIIYWAMPFILGSLYAFIVFLPYPLILAKRVKNEEEVLERGLAGYGEYKNRVKYRIIPFIW